MVDAFQTEESLDIWQADQFDIAKANSKSLDDTTKKIFSHRHCFQKNHLNFQLQKQNHKKDVFKGSGLQMEISLGLPTLKVETAFFVSLVGYFFTKVWEKVGIKILDIL
uniref:Uncharacterized protein n=1 Tax=Bactrocera dorsalis TaxID=27457 RepID=A0A034WQW4_BACDO